MADDFQLPQDWTIQTIGSLGRVATGKTPSTKIGDHFGGHIPFITPSDMHGRRIISYTARYLTDQGATSVSSAKIPTGAVMVSCIGSDMGKTAIAGCDAVTNQQINSIIVREGISNIYVYYNLSTRQGEIQHLGSGGSAVPILNKGHFCQLEIALPPLKEQQAIACILGALDDKIELNRRMNRTLEEMARAIFKSWFVDFAPVRAKGAVRQEHPRWTNEQVSRAACPNLRPDLAALFPDSFEDSELGEIPRGWRVSCIGEVCEVIDCLHTKKPDRRESGKPLLQLSNIRDDGLIDMTDTYFIDDSDYSRWISRMEAVPGDCVITNVGRVGAVAQIPEGLRGALGRNMTGLRCRTSSVFPTFMIELLMSEFMRNEIRLRMDSGTILDALNVRSIPHLRLCRANDELLLQFECKVRPMRARMERLLRESRTLAALRDALLPKLIFGELRVPDAERIVGRAT
jgi:type I restriction enzyme S subunit